MALVNPQTNGLAEPLSTANYLLLQPSTHGEYFEPKQGLPGPQSPANQVMTAGEFAHTTLLISKKFLQFSIVQSNPGLQVRDHRPICSRYIFQGNFHVPRSHNWSEST